MKLFYPSIICLVLTLGACNSKHNRTAENNPPTTPVAFQDEQKDYSLLKKRSYSDDIVEELYKELLDKNKPLSELEESISNLKDNSRDSAEDFNTFDSRNTSYYNSTATHIGSIKDSVLKNKIKQLIDNSLAGYKNKIAPHNTLLSTINDKNIRLNDLHTVLKLTQTLAVIEKYQSSQLPSLKGLEAINKSYDKIISKTDSLTGLHFYP
jgi:DNA gyrase/topoisomerase IV subunit B